MIDLFVPVAVNEPLIHPDITKYSCGVIDVFKEDVITIDEAAVLVSELNGQSPGLPRSKKRSIRRHAINTYFNKHNIPISEVDRHTRLVRRSDVLLYFKITHQGVVKCKKM